MDFAEQPLMNMANIMVSMKSAYSEVSKKPLTFENCSSDTREPSSYPHIQRHRCRIFRGRYDLSDEFFFINWGISKVFHAKNSSISQIWRSKIFKIFLSVGNCSKKKSEKKSWGLSQDLNPGPHDWKESVLTTRPSWNVIIIGEK